MIENSSVVQAMHRFIDGEKATADKLFDDLLLEEKNAALEDHSRLALEQQTAFREFMTNESTSRAICGFLCFLAVKANENESVLVTENLINAIDQYNEKCAYVFGAVDPAKVVALLSIPGVREELGFASPCLLLANAKLPKLAFFALINDISGFDDEPAYRLVMEYGIGLDKNFPDYQWMNIPDAFCEGLIAHPDRSKTGWILTRLLLTCVKISDGSFLRIADHLFKENDISPLQVAFISSGVKPNTHRLLGYLDRCFTDSILRGDPKYYFAYAALKLSLEDDFFAKNDIHTVCASDDPCEVALALGKLTLNVWATVHNAGTMGFDSGVAPTTAFCDRLLSFLSGDDGSLYYAAYNCVMDLFCIREFDNGLLNQTEIILKTKENLCSPVESVRRAAEGILGLMPLNTRLPGSIARCFFAKYKRASVRKDAYDPHMIFYFRAVVCCGAWRHPGQLAERYKQVYQYYVARKDEVGRTEELLLELTREELPFADKSMKKNVGTPVAVLAQSTNMPTIFDICDLSCKADRLVASPQERFPLTADEAQMVITLAIRNWLGLEIKHLNLFQIKVLLSRCDLPENVGSAVIVQWFQWMCNYDCEAAVGFYDKYHYLLNRPGWYPYDDFKSTFSVFGAFFELPSRLEMVMAEAIMVSKNANVPRLFATAAFAPISLPEELRESIAGMLEKKTHHELPISEEQLTEWLGISPDIISNPFAAWKRFYDDEGVAQLAVESDTKCDEAVLEFGYGVNETVAAAALRKDPLITLPRVSAHLHNSDIIHQALREGIRNLQAEE